MSKHQYAMVMDLNKCLGCQTCTIACKKRGFVVGNDLN